MDINNWVSEQQSRLRSDSPILGYPDLHSSYNPLLSPSPNYTRDLSTDQEQHQLNHDRDLSAFLNHFCLDSRDKPLPPPPPPSSSSPTISSSSSPRPVPKPLIIPSSISRRSSHQSFSTTPSRRSSRFPSISSTLDESTLSQEDIAQRTPTVHSAFRLPRPIDIPYSPAMTNLTTPALSPTTSTFSATTTSSHVFLSSPYASSPTSSSSLHSAFSYRLRGRSSTVDIRPSQSAIARKQSAPALYGRQFDFDYDPDVVQILPEHDAPGASKWSLGSSHADPQIPSPDPSISIKEKKGKRQRLLSLVSRFTTTSPISPSPPSPSISPATTLPPSPIGRPRTLSTLSLGVIGRTKSLSASSWHKRKLIVRGIAEHDQKASDAVRAWCETFGEVRRFSRKPNGDLHIDFKKSSVADTVCRLETRVFIKGAGSVSLSWYQGKYTR